MIFEGSNKEWQTKKTEYIKESMTSMLSLEDAKKMFVDLQVEDGSGSIIYEQWLFTHDEMEHKGIGSWIFPDPYITRAMGRYYYWWIETQADGYVYKTIDDVTDIILTRDMVIERAIWLSILGFLLLIIVGYTFSGYVLRPIQDMNTATRKFSLSEKWDIPHVGIYGNIKDEVVILAQSLEALFSRVNKEAERLEQFSDDIAHEIKNKLFEVMSFLDLSLHAKNPSESIIKAKNTLKQLSNVVDALLFFARNDTQTPENIDILSFLKTSLIRFDSRISFIEESKLTLPIYPELFLTAVENIITNAMKFTPQDGEIIVKTTQKGIAISDTGIGIANAHIPHIFDRLYKVDKARTDKSWQWLGLSISKKIIEELHHLKLSVTSEKGNGTTFFIEIPEATLNTDYL